MFRTAFLILSGNAAASLLMLLRNLLIARMIPVADFGVAATLAIAMSIVEMVSAFGLQQQIIQAKNGDDPRFQAALQGFQVVRGLFSGLLLAVLAGPIADFMNVPEATWGHRLMALVPVLNALGHFDHYRLNRKGIFGPMILASLLPALASLLAVWPLVAWFGDWRAMLFAILIQSVVGMISTHIVAERPYRLVLDRAIIRESVIFGWPLLLNNVLLFLVFNGDRIVVGRLLGMESLAIFSMGMTLTLAPTLVMGKSIQNFFLPRLSEAAHGEGPKARRRFFRLSQGAHQSGFFTGGLLVVATVLLGGPFVRLALGAQYAALVPLIDMMAVMQAARIFKTGSSTIALARGKAGNAAMANLVRLVSLPLAWLAVQQGFGLEMVIWIGILAESVGFAVSLLLLRSRFGASLRPLAAPVLATALLLALPLVLREWPGVPEWTVALAVVLAFGVQLATMRTIRAPVLAALARKLGR
ncbi:oligosaccharide flippase family protein [Rubellimicrobium aerolatum]|uniref:Oligosaccharide flippase family protein n=1 Tax=Rubellimicrobium aerolatum TaxID=490979 RepID=A0ABW0S9E8_9RHOB|nr:oligosaccharide flippase family protein [Rubellimicrobium aerolatum]MBP1804925.1 O-antigen/teichoic acid export membrane protein [Rubellimicrobium aerolatum]